MIKKHNSTTVTYALTSLFGVISILLIAYIVVRGLTSLGEPGSPGDEAKKQQLNYTLLASFIATTIFGLIHSRLQTKQNQAAKLIQAQDVAIKPGPTAPENPTPSTIF